MDEYDQIINSEQQLEEFLQRIGPYAPFPRTDAFWKREFENSVKQRLLLRHAHEVQNLPNFHCHISGHSVLVYDDCDIGLQRATQDNSEGLYIYHYLIERFQQVKKRLQKINPETLNHEPEKLMNLIRFHKQTIQDLKEQYHIITNYDRLQDDVKTCPFVKMRPQTYHKRAIHLTNSAVAPVKKKTRKQAEQSERE